MPEPPHPQSTCAPHVYRRRFVFLPEPVNGAK